MTIVTPLKGGVSNAQDAVGGAMISCNIRDRDLGGVGQVAKDASTVAAKESLRLAAGMLSTLKRGATKVPGALSRAGSSLKGKARKEG